MDGWFLGGVQEGGEGGEGAEEEGGLDFVCAGVPVCRLLAHFCGC